MSIPEAIAEIGKMAKFAKAFEGAEVVLRELAGIDQNKRELLSAVDKLKADQAGLTIAVDAARKEFEKVTADTKADGKKLAEAAKAKAESVVSAAEAKAAAIVSDAEAKAAKAAEAAALSEKAAAEAEAKRAIAASDLDDLTQRIENAKAKLRALVA